MKTTKKFLYFFFIVSTLLNLSSCSMILSDAGREQQVKSFKSQFSNENFRIRFANYPTLFIKNITSFEHICNGSNLEIMWIQDLSKSFSSWASLITELADNLIENIIQQYSNVKISISGFTDRNSSLNNTTPDMCYKPFLNFTSNRTAIRDAMSKFEFVPCGGQREDSLSALFLGSNWKYHQGNDSMENTSFPATRIIVLVTDAEGKLGKNVNQINEVHLRDNSPASIQNFCAKNTIPTVDILKNKLAKENIVLALVVPNSVKRFYNNLLFELQVPGAVYSFDDVINQKLHLGDIIDRSSCAAEFMKSPNARSGLALLFPELTYLHNASESFEMLPLVGHRKRNCLGKFCMKFLFFFFIQVLFYFLGFSCDQSNRTIKGAISHMDGPGSTGKRIVLVVGSAGVLILLSALSTLWHLRKDRVEKDESVVFNENSLPKETLDRENLVSAELGAFA
jgi:hypothetical protein